MAKATSNAIGKALATGFVAAAVILAAVVLRRLDQRPRTTDAIVTANTIQVAPEITGRIDALNVKDDAVVKKGDVLFTIEAEQYQLALARARAQDATDTLERMEPLLVDRYVTPHQIDQARTARATAESDVRGALSSREQSRWQVGDTRPLAAQLEAARAQVGLA